MTENETRQTATSRTPPNDPPVQAAGEKPQAAGERPRAAEEKPAAAGEKPATIGEKPQAADEKPSAAGEKPAMIGEKAAAAEAKKPGRARKPRSGKKSKSATGTREWSDHSVNCQDGCEHACIYCYARANALRFGKIASGAAWARPVIDAYAVRKDHGRLDGIVMFPTRHDITPGNLDACLAVLCRLAAAGNRILIVSKPHFACVREMTLRLAEWRKQLLFRFSIGCLDDEIRRFWEPGAPPIPERIAALQEARLAGYATSVSCEPLLKPWNIADLLNAVAPYVTDSIWIGKLNMLRHRTAWLGMSPGGADRQMIVELEAWQRAERIREVADLAIEWGLAYHNAHPEWPAAIRWKESYKKALGLPLASEPGLDV